MQFFPGSSRQQRRGVFWERCNWDCNYPLTLPHLRCLVQSRDITGHLEVGQLLLRDVTLLIPFPAEACEQVIAIPLLSLLMDAVLFQV